MSVYQVGIARYYAVIIEAKDEEKAKELAGFFLSSCHDDSTDDERTRYNFKIHEIEMVENDSFLL
jgi:hypothetical protein